MPGFGFGSLRTGRRRGNGAVPPPPPPITLTPGTLAWSSVRFPPENGEDPVSLATSLAGESGLLYLPNTNNIFRTALANDTPWLGASAGAIFGTCTIEPLIYDALNRAPYLCGTNIEQASQLARNFAVRYTPLATATNLTKAGRFSFVCRGEAGETTNGVIVDSAPVPAGTTRILWALRYDPANVGGEFVFDIWDCETGTKTAGTATAKPGGGTGWTGIKRTTNNFSIGGLSEARFPLMASTNTPQTINAFRGEIGFIMLADRNPSDAELQAIALGADPGAVVLAANRRLFCPLTAGGVQSLAVTSRLSAVVDSLVQRGALYPGSTIQRQSSGTAAAAGKYFTVGRLPDPCLCGVAKGESLARLDIPFRFAGVSGAIEMRVQDEDGMIVGADWQAIGTLPGSGSSGSYAILLPFHPGDKAYRLSFRVADGLGGYLTARVNSDIVVALVAAHVGQSEMVRGLAYNVTVTGSTGNTLNGSYTGTGGGKYVYRCDWNAALGKPVIIRSRHNMFYAGAGQIRLANRLRGATTKPLVFVNAAVSGTSLFAWLDDGQSSRQWSDFALALSALGNRDASGRPVIRAAVLMWEAFFTGTSWAAQVLQPLATGVQSAVQSVSFIAQADIDHYLFDGVTLNPAFDLVVMPANRAQMANAGISDGIDMADRRRDMRINSKAVFPAALIGPESAAHACELSGSDASTHPDTARETGIGPWCRALADGYAIGFGIKTYGGPYIFDSYAWGTSSSEVIATVSGAVGNLDTDGNLNAASYGTAPVSPVGLLVEGWEVDAGGIGVWTNQGFTAAITGARTVAITKASGTWPAGTRFRFHSGAPGGYAGYSGAGADGVESQWVKRAPYFAGYEVAGDNTAWTVV